MVILIDLYKFSDVGNVTPEFGFVSVGVGYVGEHDGDCSVAVWNFQEVLQSVIDQDGAFMNRFLSYFYCIVSDQANLFLSIIFTYLNNFPKFPQCFPVLVSLRLVELARKLEHGNVGLFILILNPLQHLHIYIKWMLILLSIYAHS